MRMNTRRQAKSKWRWVPAILLVGCKLKYATTQQQHLTGYIGQGHDDEWYETETDRRPYLHATSSPYRES